MALNQHFNAFLTYCEGIYYLLWRLYLTLSLCVKCCILIQSKLRRTSEKEVFHSRFECEFEEPSLLRGGIALAMKEQILSCFSVVSLIWCQPFVDTTMLTLSQHPQQAKSQIFYLHSNQTCYYTQWWCVFASWNLALLSVAAVGGGGGVQLLSLQPFCVKHFFSGSNRTISGIISAFVAALMSSSHTTSMPVHQCIQQTAQQLTNKKHPKMKTRNNF